MGLAMHKITHNWRNDFPVLSKTMNGKPVAFLDSAASAQKPKSVIDAMTRALDDHYANIHRGLYDFSGRTTAEFEAVRGKVANFLNAMENEIVFTRNATESINLVASSYGRAHFKAGDEVILTEMEHHANIVPWHLLRDQIGIVIKYIPIMPDGTLALGALDGLLTDKTKLVAFTHISNALGTINPVQDIVARVKAFNGDIRILIDGSQSTVHMPINVRDLGCDWFVFTGHKLYGPTGVGVLWGRSAVLETMPPYQGGGDMIEHVALERITYKSPPHRFEAGTPAIAEVIALGAAIDYVQDIGWDAITSHEKILSEELFTRLSVRKDIRILSPAADRAGIVSFVGKTADAADIGMILDQCGVAVRVGHHCCEPLMSKLGVTGTVRASLGVYSNMADIDALSAGLDKAGKLLS